MNIFLNCNTETHTNDCIIAMASLLSHNKNIKFFLLDKKTPKMEKLILNLKKFNFEYEYLSEELLKLGYSLFSPYLIKTNELFKLPTYYRLLIPLFDLDKAINIDTDIVCVKELTSYYENFENSLIMGIIDNPKLGQELSCKVLNLEYKTYINAGFTIQNTSKMREEKIFDKYIETYNLLNSKELLPPNYRRYLGLHDQDVINLAIKDKKLINIKNFTPVGIWHGDDGFITKNDINLSDVVCWHYGGPFKYPRVQSYWKNLYENYLNYSHIEYELSSFGFKNDI